MEIDKILKKKKPPTTPLGMILLLLDIKTKTIFFKLTIFTYLDMQ